MTPTRNGRPPSVMAALLDAERLHLCRIVCLSRGIERWTLSIEMEQRLRKERGDLDPAEPNFWSFGGIFLWLRFFFF